MPVIRPANRTEPFVKIRESLSDQLFKELMGERSRSGPVIFEIPTDEPSKIDVLVFWEAWKALPSQDRSFAVRAAYARFALELKTSSGYKNPGIAGELLVPTPASIDAVTWEDLTIADLLPFKVEPLAVNFYQDDRHAEKSMDFEDVRLLMLENGAISTPFGLQLRFPTESMASDALSRLNEELPEARWTLVESTFGPIMG